MYSTPPQAIPAIDEMAEPTLFIGNDIVDLKTPDSVGKSMNRRYVERVFTPEELLSCGSFIDDHILWCTWAAKESVHKIVAKAFHHWPTPRSMRVEPATPWLQKPTCGVVVWEDIRFPVRWRWTGDYIHAMAWWASPEAEESAAEVLTRIDTIDAHDLKDACLTLREAQSAGDPGSAAGRRLVRQLMAQGRRSYEMPLEILRPANHRGFGPPELWSADDHISEVDVSISHHGRYVSAVISKPMEGGHHA